MISFKKPKVKRRGRMPPPPRIHRDKKKYYRAKEKGHTQEALDL